MYTHMFLKGTCESEAEAGHRASGQQKDSKPYGRSARGTTKVAWQGRPQRKDPHNAGPHQLRTPDQQGDGRQQVEQMGHKITFILIL